VHLDLLGFRMRPGIAVVTRAIALSPEHLTPVWLFHLIPLCYTYTLLYYIAMPPPTATQKPTKAAAKDGSVKAPTASANGANGAAAGSDEKKTGFTKPDQAKYNAEQDEINKEIAAVKTKMVS
jgi:hypothetical protein